MQFQKFKLLFTALPTAAALIFTGCSDVSVENSSTTETSVATAATETTAITEAVTTTVTDNPDDLLKTIGTMSETTTAIHLSNQTDMAITKVAICKAEDADFSDNLMENSDLFAAEEERILYYEFAKDSEANADATYTIQLTFEDETTVLLHQFPFNDISAGEIRMEDSVAYLVYTSSVTKKEVNTKEAEQAILQSEKAEDTPEESYEQDDFQQWNNDNDYEEPVESVADAPAIDLTPDESDADTGANDIGGADPNDGCLGDEGLFY